MPQPAAANLLAAEKSPYLLQHAGNPVHWRPWGEAALAAAREQDKPLFLSIGYSACHWCHVMERESFEDAEVAAALNAHFICVKVDREERPDVDAVFMTACQMTTGRGGWPLTVFATPGGEPFFTATYLPPRAVPGRPGQPGLLDMATHIGRLWREDRATLAKAAAQVAEHLAGYYAGAAKGGALPGPQLAQEAVRELALRYDQRFGGFGSGPKFPAPHTLVFLLREARRSGQAAPRDMALHTLSSMRLGGLFDHVGLGFFRYSTDEKWLLPHFEKMLCDQAGLALACLEAFAATGAPLPARTAEETCDYVTRVLTAPGGAFYSAEDADSPDGKGGHGEGAHYVWTTAEIMALLGPDDGAFVTTRFGMQAGGNYRDEATRQPTGANILHLRSPLPAAEDARWERIRPRLLAARAGPPPPPKKKKILADWNGQMITALARTSRLLDRPDLLEAAGHAADFVLTAMVRPDGGLWHSWCAGQAAVPGTADDYAALVRALLELYAAGHDPDRLARALELQRRMDQDFWDPAAPGGDEAAPETPGMGGKHEAPAAAGARQPGAPGAGAATPQDAALAATPRAAGQPGTAAATPGQEPRADAPGAAPTGSGYFLTAGQAPGLPARPKEVYDGPHPSANALALGNLLTLGRLTGDPAHTRRAEALLAAFAGNLAENPSAHAHFLCGLLRWLTPGPDVVVVGTPGSPDTAALLATLRTQAPPDTLVLLKNPADARLDALAPFTRDMAAQGGKATVYICRDQTYAAPTTDPARLPF